MIKIYVSGQISGLPEAEAKAAFQEAEKMLFDKGYECVFNPLVLAEVRELLQNRKLTYKEHLLQDLEVLVSCDVIYMLRGYAKSKGALAELAFAEACGLQVRYWYGDASEPRETSLNVAAKDFGEMFESKAFVE